MNVYIVKCDNDDSYRKIGMSGSALTRLSELQTSNPYELLLERIIETSSEDKARQLERHLHDVYSDQRVRGEWFDIDDVEKITLCAKEWIDLNEQMQPDEIFLDLLEQWEGYLKGGEHDEKKAQRFDLWVRKLGIDTLKFRIFKSVIASMNMGDDEIEKQYTLRTGRKDADCIKIYNEGRMTANNIKSVFRECFIIDPNHETGFRIKHTDEYSARLNLKIPHELRNIDKRLTSAYLLGYK